MDSPPDSSDSFMSPKRRKLDYSDGNSELLREELITGHPLTYSESQMDAQEGVSPDCDSGYEASTLESFPAPRPVDQSSNISRDVDEVEDEEDDDRASTVSGLSELSGLSGLSGQDWKPMAGSMLWVQKQMANGVDPRSLLPDSSIPDNVDNLTLWKIIINMLTEPPRRAKLRHINTLDDVLRLLKTSKRIMVLTGAGVSVSCGIPDFRSRDGIYARLAQDFPDLPDPQSMFDIAYFARDPRPFFKFARDIYPGRFKPSPCHRFIKLLERQNKLLRNYTQNIDTLEREAGIERVVECHGSFASATCTRCSFRAPSDTIRADVLEQRIPLCPRCLEGGATEAMAPNYNELVSKGIMKPDIVFFGEGLPDSFHTAMTADRDICDLLIVIGSSLKVRPVALIPGSLPAAVPQILINREPLPHCRFDVELLGDCDVIINQLCYLLGEPWTEICWTDVLLKEANTLLPPVLYQENSIEEESTPSSSPGPSSSPIQNRQIKERHVSTDSTRDSGIESGDTSSGMQLDERLRHSVASRLLPDTYFHVPPHRYVFPGAEVYVHPDQDDDTSSSRSFDDDDDDDDEDDDSDRSELESDANQADIDN